MTTSRTWLSSTSIASLNPRHSAISAVVGSRSITSRRQITSGISAVETWKWSRISWAIASRSRSMTVAGGALRARRSRLIFGAEDEDVAEALVEKQCPSENERAHHDRAQLRVRLHQSE